MNFSPRFTRNQDRVVAGLNGTGGLFSPVSGGNSEITIIHPQSASDVGILKTGCAGAVVKQLDEQCTQGRVDQGEPRGSLSPDTQIGQDESGDGQLLANQPGAKYGDRYPQHEPQAEPPCRPCPGRPATPRHSSRRRGGAPRGRPPPPSRTIMMRSATPTAEGARILAIGRGKSMARMPAVGNRWRECRRDEQGEKEERQGDADERISFRAPDRQFASSELFVVSGVRRVRTRPSAVTPMVRTMITPMTRLGVRSIHPSVP